MCERLYRGLNGHRLGVGEGRLLDVQELQKRDGAGVEWVLLRQMDWAREMQTEQTRE